VKPDHALLYSVQISQHHILATGSYSSASTEATVIDLSENTVKPTTPMHTARRYHAITKYGDKVFIMGGWDTNNNDLASCEVFDILMEKWDPIASLNQKRRLASAVAIPGGKIYILGGYCDGVG
jgi:hypothetical protein